MKDFVMESRILRCTDLKFFGDRAYREFVIEGNEGFAPGQYLMIRTKNREVGWPYPYFIHGKTKKGLLVLAREDQDLYSGREGDAVQYWGPRGTSPLHGEELPVLVTEPAVYFAVYPFVCEKAYRRLIIVGNGSTAPADCTVSEEKIDSVENVDFAERFSSVEELKSVEFCSNICEAAKLLETEAGRGPVITALNPGTAKAFAETVSTDRKNDTVLFVSNKKACGIDGCKGCYLHSGDVKFGINVCCKGPFMPLPMIDFEADGRCFETYL